MLHNCVNWSSSKFTGFQRAVKDAVPRRDVVVPEASMRGLNRGGSLGIALSPVHR